VLDADRLQRLLAVGRSLVSELELDTVLDRLLATAQELTGAPYAAVGVLDESRQNLSRFITRGVDADTHHAIGDLPRGRGVLGVLITEPRPLRLDDVSAHPSSYGFPPGHPPMGTFLGVPVLIRGEAWGNLYLTDKESGFDADDEEAAIVLADWAGVAIENARLYTAAEGRRAELERAVRGFEATASIAQAIGGETELDRVLELITKRGRALVEARAVSILLREGDELTVGAAAGEGLQPTGSRIGIAGAHLTNLIEGRRAIRTADLAELDIAIGELGMTQGTAGLLMPLVYRGRALGALVAVDRLRGGDTFTDDDEQVFRAFAASAATAVATAQNVESDRLRRTLEAAEAERRRWARELHDETLQGLAALKVMLGAAARADSPEAVRQAITEAVDHVGSEIDKLRAIITDLRPAALDELGLIPALGSLAERTAGRAGLVVETDLPDSDGADRLPPAVETTIYRVAQEALTNVTKHAGATNARLALRLENGSAEVSVADDGTGFDPEDPTTGFGLMGMRERVNLAGGDLRFAREDGWTVVTARVPLHAAT
jgi:signal transduction histidine kinase